MTPPAPRHHPTTPDGRYFVVRGRLWRCANPTLPDDERARLVRDLMASRRAMGAARRAGDRAAGAEARARVQAAKVALGERGPSGGRRRARPQPEDGAEHSLRRVVGRGGGEGRGVSDERWGTRASGVWRLASSDGGSRNRSAAGGGRSSLVPRPYSAASATVGITRVARRAGM
jgi:hypothetical protein